MQTIVAIEIFSAILLVELMLFFVVRRLSRTIVSHDGELAAALTALVTIGMIMFFFLAATALSVVTELTKFFSD